MPTKIILKKSSVSGRIPDQSTLDYGELALNYTDGVLYYKNSENIVQSISAGLDSDLTLQLMESSYAAINTSLIPSADSTYDLGTPTKKWKELYLSGNTIHLGDAKLSADASGNIEVKDKTGQLRKLVVDEIEVGTGANRIKLKANNGQLKIDDVDDIQQRLNLSLNSTSDLPEGTNKYYTDARVSTLVSSSYIQARQIRGADSSWVTNQINDLIDAAPGALDTLAELASAIGDDANFSTTITNLIATMPDSAYVASYVSSQLPRYGTDYVDSAYVLSVTPRYGTDYVDSSYVLSVTPKYGTDYVDSSWVIDQGYITDYTVTESDVTQHQDALSITESQISDFGSYATIASLAAVATSGNYSDLSGTPTNVSDFTNDAGYISNVSAVDSAYIRSRQITYSNVSEFSNDAGYITGVAFSDITSKPTTISGYGITDAFDGNYNSLTNKPSLFDGNYNSLTNKPTIPTNNNQLTNGAGYITDVSAVDEAYVQARQIRGADSSWVSSEINSAVNNIIDGAPTALDTLSEIASAYANADSDLQTLITSNGSRLTTLESEVDTLQSWGNHANVGYLTAGTVKSTIDSAYVKSVSYNDNESLSFGASNDLQISHNSGSNINTINSTATLGTQLNTMGDFTIRGNAGYEDIAIFRSSSSVELYFNNSIRLETTDAGVTISGVVSATGGTSTNWNTAYGWGNHANAGYLTDYTVTEADVTTHQAALSITESQISDLSHYTDSDVRVLVDSSYINNRVALSEAQISSVVDSDYILSRSTSVEIYDAYDSFISRHQLKLKADIQNGHVVVVGQIEVNDSIGNPRLADLSFHSAGGTGTIDSAGTLDIVTSTIDSSYIQSKLDGTYQSARDYTSYVFTPSVSTTQFSGSDRNGNTLAYTSGKVEVYLNGVRLVSGLDYTETSSSVLTLSDPIGSGDVLEVVSLSTVVFDDSHIKSVDSSYTTTTADQILDRFDKTSYRTSKYLVDISCGNKYHSEEILLTHNNSTVGMISYAQILMDSNLGTFDADISNGYVRLKFTPTYSNTDVKTKVIRTDA